MATTQLNLPAEVCSHVVQYARSSDLPALGCTSKAFQTPAETRLYHHVIMRDPASAYRLCSALYARESFRATYVKRLWVYQDSRFNRPHHSWTEETWTVIGKLLTKLVNLEMTYIFDDTCAHSWIFDTSRIQFRLREANLGFHWDDAFVSFLESQSELRMLTVQTPEEDCTTSRSLASGSLQKLESYDGPLFIATEIILSPLRQLNLRVDEESAPMFSAYLAEFSRVNKTLRSLNVQHVPEYLVVDSLHILASSPLSASLRYLGILNLPATEHHDIHRSLLKFERLEVIQVDLTHWSPVPVFCHYPMIATELRTFCTTLRCVVIWVSSHQYIGRFENERWIFQHLAGQRHSSRDGQWREY